MEGGFGQVLLQAWDAQVTRCSGGHVARCLGDQALLLVFILREVLNCKLCSSIAAFLPELFWRTAQGCGEAVQVGHKTAANDRHLSNAGQGHSICSDILVKAVFCGTFLMLGKVIQYVLIYWLLLCFVKVYLRLDQPLAALEVRWELLSVFTFFI